MDPYLEGPNSADGYGDAQDDPHLAGAKMMDPKPEMQSSSSSWLPRRADLPPPPPPPPRTPPPAADSHTSSDDAKRTGKSRRVTVPIQCADNCCDKRCEAYGCLYGAIHCPGTPASAVVCTVHYDFAGRCPEKSFWCLNRVPADGSCIENLCGVHCMNTACPRHFGEDKPTMPSTNRKRGLRNALNLRG